MTTNNTTNNNINSKDYSCKYSSNSNKVLPEDTPKASAPIDDHYTILYYTILYYTIPYYTILYYIKP